LKSKFTSLLVTCLVIIILVAGCIVMKYVKAGVEAAQKERAGVVDTSVPVQVGHVGKARIDTVVEFNGDIQPLQSVDLQPRIAGRLLKLEHEDGTPVEEGTFVRKGEKIAQIDDRELRATAEAAKAQVKSAEADIISLEAGMTTAKANVDSAKAALVKAQAATASARAAFEDKDRELKRQRGLMDKGATSQQSLDLALTAYDQAKAGLAQAEASELSSEAAIQSAEAGVLQAEAAIGRGQAELLKAKASLQAAEVNLSETQLYAPLDGFVSKRHADPGAMVTASTPIVTILQLDEVKVILAVPMNHLAKLVPGKTTAKLTTISLAGEELDCVISKIYPAVETTTRTAQVELRIKNQPNENGQLKLRSGMYATVKVLVDSKPDVIAVDMSLPIRVLNKYVVFVTDGDTVHAVNVKLGTSYGDKIEILSGLTDGQEIVTVGQHRLTDGAKINRIDGQGLTKPVDGNDIL